MINWHSVGRGATDAAKKAAKNPSVKKAAAGAAGAAGTYVATQGGEGVVKSFRSRRKRKTAKRMALDLARQVGGKYSERTLVDNEYRFVVWLDDEPIAAFPPLPLEKEAQPLRERVELARFDRALLKDPPRE